MNNGINYEYSGYQDFVAQELVGTTVSVQNIESQTRAPESTADSRLQQATASGWLRIGHSSDSHIAMHDWRGRTPVTRNRT